MAPSADAALQKLTTVECTALGIIGGIIEVSLLQPILYLKNASQQGLPFTLDPKLLYRGIGVSCINMGIITGLQFPVTGAVTKVITGGAERPLTGPEEVSAAVVGGAISGLACGPMELVMIQQQRYGLSILGTPTKLYSSFGAGGFLRGIGMSCGREGVYTGGYLGAAPVLTKSIKENFGASDGVAKIGAAIAGGCCAATLSHPMDTIKTCQQGDVAGETYGSVVATAKTLYEKQGIGSFFRGYFYRTGRMICAVFLLNECKLKLSPLMFPHHFK